MEKFSIGAVAQMFGVSTSALRYYERRGIVPAPERVNGRRHYTQVHIEKLAILRVAQRGGFSLVEIQQVLRACDASVPISTTWHRYAQQKLIALEEQISNLQNMKQVVEQSLTCGCVSLTTCNLVQGVLDT